jgi:D-alanyl-D-alanine carboxypeptidase
VPADGSFRIGSATKMFTSVVVLQLAAEGRLDLDRPVQHYLPGLLPQSYPDVSIRQLLDHTSGLPVSREDEPASDPAWFVEHRFEGWTPRQVLDSAFTQPMEFAPGTQQHYNGVNYFVAGLLVEKLTGHSFAAEVRSRIARPLGLDNTYVPVDNDPRLRGRHAHGYVDVDGTLVDITEQSPYSWAEGGMVSTSADLTRFVGALFRGRLLPPTQQRALFRVPDVKYGGGGQCSVGPEAGRACFSAGLQRTAFPNGVTVWGKSGGVPGYTTAAFATRDLRRVLVYSLTPTGNRDGSEGSYVQNLAGATFDPDLLKAAP